MNYQIESLYFPCALLSIKAPPCPSTSLRRKILCIWIFHVEWADLSKSVQFTPSWALALKGAREEKEELLKCECRPAEGLGLVWSHLFCSFASFSVWGVGFCVFLIILEHVAFQWRGIFPGLYFIHSLVSPLLFLALYLGLSVLHHFDFDSLQTLGGRGTDWIMAFC